MLHTPYHDFVQPLPKSTVCLGWVVTIEEILIELVREPSSHNEINNEANSVDVRHWVGSPS